MKKEALLRSFERCLKAHNLEPMTKDLYHFFMNICGFIAHYNINGFRGTYDEPTAFVGFIEELKLDLVCRPSCDESDSFKWDYDFYIPEVKKAMMDLIAKYEPTIMTECRKDRMRDLNRQREVIEIELRGLGGN
jgi:hypothetical protein